MRISAVRRIGGVYDTVGECAWRGAGPLALAVQCAASAPPAAKQTTIPAAARVFVDSRDCSGGAREDPELVAAPRLAARAVARRTQTRRRRPMVLTGACKSNCVQQSPRLIPHLFVCASDIAAAVHDDRLRQCTQLERGSHMRLEQQQLIEWTSSLCGHQWVLVALERSKQQYYRHSQK